MLEVMTTISVLQWIQEEKLGLKKRLEMSKMAEGTIKNSRTLNNKHLLENLKTKKEKDK